MGRTIVKAGPGINMRSYLKNNQSKKGCRHGSSNKHLPSKPEALSSNPSMRGEPIQLSLVWLALSHSRVQV
jgi:hypothetical protein